MCFQHPKNLIDQVLNAKWVLCLRRLGLISILAVVLLILAIPGQSEKNRYGMVVPASEILATIEKGQPVEYRNIIIDGDLNLSEKIVHYLSITDSRIEGQVNFNGSAFTDAVNFSSCEFTGQSHFREVVFKKGVNLSFVDFSNFADFSDAKFDRIVVFEGSQFNGNADFDDTQFKGSAYFDGSKFNGDANFDHAQFGGRAYFDGSKFNGDANFDRAEFEGSAYFSESRFNGSADFLYTRFNDRAKFEETHFREDTDFEDSQFNEDADFWDSQFKDNADFSGIKFNGSADFRDARFEGFATFDESHFYKSSIFKMTTFLKRASFVDSYFSDNAFFEGANFGGDCRLHIVRPHLKNLYLRWDSISHCLVFDEETYLFLIENYKRLGWLDDADDCYYQYRSELRGQLLPNEIILQPLEYSFSIMSDWFFGYGMKPDRPLISSAIFIVVFAIVWRIVGVRIQERKDFFDEYAKSDGSVVAQEIFKPLLSIREAFFFSTTILLSGMKIYINPPNRPDLPGRMGTAIKWIFTVERIFGMLFIFLFILAVTRTVIRG